MDLDSPPRGTLPQSSRPRAAYELQFSVERAAFAFPCDVQGRVDMDLLCDRARNDYLFARAVMKLKRESAAPEVVCHRTDRKIP